MKKWGGPEVRKSPPTQAGGTRCLTNDLLLRCGQYRLGHVHSKST